MPVDSTPVGAEVQVAAAPGELLLAYFKNGSLWHRGTYGDDGGSRCLLGAMISVFPAFDVRDDATRRVHAAVVRWMLERGRCFDWLANGDQMCIPLDKMHIEIAQFNDSMARGFGDIAAVCRDVK